MWRELYKEGTSKKISPLRKEVEVREMERRKTKFEAIYHKSRLQSGRAKAGDRGAVPLSRRIHHDFMKN